MEADELREIIEIALFAPYVKNSEPVSIIFVDTDMMEANDILKEYRNSVPYISYRSLYGNNAKEVRTVLFPNMMGCYYYASDIRIADEIIGDKQIIGVVPERIIKDNTQKMFAIKYSLKDMLHITARMHETPEDWIEGEKFVDKITFEEKDISPQESFLKDIVYKVANIAKENGMYGFRMAKQFQTLLKASALRDGRTEVTQEDVDKIEKLLPWINFELRG